jgi:hypothetical protein
MTHSGSWPVVWFSGSGGVALPSARRRQKWDTGASPFSHRSRLGHLREHPLHERGIAIDAAWLQ